MGERQPVAACKTARPAGEQLVALRVLRVGKTTGRHRQGKAHYDRMVLGCQPLPSLAGLPATAGGESEHVRQTLP